MYKFKNANTNIWYIYNPTSMYCFAYYDDDYIPDAYGKLMFLINIDLLGTLIIKHYLYSDLTNNYYEYNQNASIIII